MTSVHWCLRKFVSVSTHEQISSVCLMLEGTIGSVRKGGKKERKLSIEVPRVVWNESSSGIYVRAGNLAEDAAEKRFCQSQLSGLYCSTDAISAFKIISIENLKWWKRSGSYENLGFLSSEWRHFTGSNSLFGCLAWNLWSIL